DAVVRYQAAVDDDVFELDVGLELLVETARLWRSLGHHDAEGRFRIDGVTGPDEYSAVADNNVFTNLLAQRNMLAAADGVARHPRRLRARNSSLSACTQALVAAAVGHLDLAYPYFGEASLMDLHDIEHNTRDGVHIAALAGAWLAAVAGFGGMRDHDGFLSFAPRLPARLERLAFGLRFRGRLLKVAATKTEATYSLSEGE